MADALQVRLLTSQEQLRASASCWNDLWQRGTSTLPTARAELIDNWLSQFGGQFRAIVVERDGQWLAALPLVATRVKRFLKAGGMPANPWGSCGDLLLDAQAAAPEPVLDRLIDGLDKLPWPLLWLEFVADNAPHWNLLKSRLQARGRAFDFRPMFRIGQVPIAGTFEDFAARWSRNHRQNLNKAANRSEREGGIRLEQIDAGTPEQIHAAVRRGFEIEDQCWKGAQGTSVIATPGMLEYYSQMATRLAQCNGLRMSILHVGQRPVAFQFATLGKGVYYALKIGYSDDAQRFSPGQLLWRQLFEHWFQQSQIKVIDFSGPMTEASSKWTTQEYLLGRLIFSTGTLWGKAVGTAYQQAAKWRPPKEASLAPTAAADKNEAVAL